MNASPLRLLLLIVGSLFCGLLAGAVIGAVGGWLYLIVISPAVAAIGGGMGARALVGVLRIHDTKAAGVVGILTTLAVLVAILVVMHQLERAAIIAELSSVGGFSDETLVRHTNDTMAKLTNDASPLMSPLMLRLHSGAQLFGDTALDLGMGFNLAVLLLELAITGLLCTRLVVERASEPFCESCDAWYARRMVGSATLGAKSTVVVDLQNTRFHRLGRHLEAASTKTRNPLILHGWFCDTCAHGDVRFELELTEPGRRARIIKTVAAPHDALEAILDSQALKKTPVRTES